ncbi:uncharacterized protein METZ01_LOCUS423599, partial [marine metagenome]
MSISIVPIGKCFAGEVSGVDLRRPLSAKTVAAIDSGMDEYAVLVFRGQDINDEEQLEFSRALGPIESSIGGNITRLDQR